MRTLLRLVSPIFAAALLPGPRAPAAERGADILVYGGTPAGVAAAVSAAREGRAVLLAEPYSFVGGLLANGLSHSDFRSLECQSGFWFDFTRRVEQHYIVTFGKDSPQVKACYRGNFGEPKVNRLVLEQMLAEQPKIRVLLRHELAGVKKANVAGGLGRIVSAAFTCGDKPGERVEAEAALFIDASYEGDLMAMAAVNFAVGREDEKAFGEPLAAKVPAGGDRQVQGCNFRWCMTQRADNKLPAPQPPGYARDEFAPVLDLYASGRLTHAFGEQGARAIFKVQPPLLPNEKTDINDMSHGIVRLSMPDIVTGYPDGDAETRRKIIARHLSYQLGLLHFLQNDPAVPPAVREDARSWGFCKDEWPGHGHLPEQLYIREGRRMQSRRVFTQNDTALAADDARSPLKQDSIAIGDYSHNCHGTGRAGSRFHGKHTGEMYQRVTPFQIPYGIIVPDEIGNLLVPVAVSSSHVGFCALRLECTWAGLGQAAGLAAQLALASQAAVQKVKVRKLQSLLHRQRAATVYVSDVPPDSASFAAAQWLGAIGGLHGRHQPPGGRQPEWKKTFGQYCEAFPLHEAGLGEPMTDAEYSRWVSLSGLPMELPLPVKGARGDYLDEFFKMAKATGW